MNCCCATEKEAPNIFGTLAYSQNKNNLDVSQVLELLITNSGVKGGPCL